MYLDCSLAIIFHIPVSVPVCPRALFILNINKDPDSNCRNGSKTNCTCSILVKMMEEKGSNFIAKVVARKAFCNNRFSRSQGYFHAFWFYFFKTGWRLFKSVLLVHFLKWVNIFLSTSDYMQKYMEITVILLGTKAMETIVQNIQNISITLRS